jgi:hypothetical protein
MSHIVDTIKRLLKDVVLFSEHASRVKLRKYQEAVAIAVVESVRFQRGLSFVVMFPRQSGKNELQAQIEAYLLTTLSLTDAEIVKVSPTYKPQTMNAMRRLQRVLENNMITRGQWRKESGYIFRMGRARIFFFSGSPEANIVGATASTLLEVDEAQDIEIGKFDKDIAPMAASTNATRIFWGTAWTSRTLLARELRVAREAEKRDGRRRTFVLSAPEVAEEVPEYGAFVNDQVAKLGRSNPMVRTQFFSEEIDAEGGMFPPACIAMMKGSHSSQDGPAAGCIYCILVDVAGEDEGVTSIETHPGKNIGAGDLASLQNPGRDSTALTIVQVDLSTMADPIIKAPSYLVVFRRQWIGVKHARLYAEIKALADCWRARWLVIDATGVGAGLASFLGNAMPGKVLPFVFNSKNKSELGWSFLGVIDSGRWKEFNPANYSGIFDHRGTEDTEKGKELSKEKNNGDNDRYPGNDIGHQMEFFHQLEFCQFEIVPGPEKKMRWGVVDGTRDPATGELVHDDLVLSAALVGVLEEQAWGSSSPAVVIQGVDPLAEMDKGF